MSLSDLRVPRGKKVPVRAGFSKLFKKTLVPLSRFFFASPRPGFFLTLALLQSRPHTHTHARCPRPPTLVSCGNSAVPAGYPRAITYRIGAGAGYYQTAGSRARPFSRRHDSPSTRTVMALSAVLFFFARCLLYKLLYVCVCVWWTLVSIYVQRPGGGKGLGRWRELQQ